MSGGKVSRNSTQEPPKKVRVPTRAVTRRSPSSTAPSTTATTTTGRRGRVTATTPAAATTTPVPVRRSERSRVVRKSWHQLASSSSASSSRSPSPSSSASSASSSSSSSSCAVSSEDDEVSVDGRRGAVRHRKTSLQARKVTSSRATDPDKEVDSFLAKRYVLRDSNTVFPFYDREARHNPKALPEYHVRWRGKSYWHTEWISVEEAQRFALRKWQNFEKRVEEYLEEYSSGEDEDGADTEEGGALSRTLSSFSLSSQDEDTAGFVDDDVSNGVEPEWLEVESILACRQLKGEIPGQFFCKFRGLPHEEAFWEDREEIERRGFSDQIESYFQRCRHAYLQPTQFPKKLPSLKLDKQPSFLTGGELREYQLEGLRWLLFSRAQQRNVMLADEMGLGKTIQAVSYLHCVFRAGVVGPHMVVAPLSTLSNWADEFRRWAPNMVLVEYSGSKNSREVARKFEFYLNREHDMEPLEGFSQAAGRRQKRLKFHVLLTSFELLALDRHFLKRFSWASLIVDEGHRLKNIKSRSFEVLSEFAKKSQHRILLTGTPLQNEMKELWTLMQFLEPQSAHFSSLEHFEAQFHQLDQEKTVKHLHSILAPHMLRRIKRDVAKDIPPKAEIFVPVSLSEEQRGLYKAVLSKNYDTLTKFSRGGSKASLKYILMHLRKVCNHPYLMRDDDWTKTKDAELNTLVKASGKMILLDKMLTKLKNRGHRVLVYFQMTRMMDIFEEYLRQKNWSYERLDGTDATQQRREMINRFNNDSSIFLFILSTRAGGLGINLQTADTVILYDSDWNPHMDAQAYSRAHRMGQKNTVMIYRLITKNSVEQRIVQIAERKKVLEHLVVRKMASTLEAGELDNILKFGSKELFDEEAEDGDSETASRPRSLEYDDTAIDQLLDRMQAGEMAEESRMEVDGGESSTHQAIDDYLGAFKVASFLENSALSQDEEDEDTVGTGQRRNFWREILHEENSKQKLKDLEELGKGMRRRKAVDYRSQMYGIAPDSPSRADGDWDFSDSDIDTDWNPGEGTASSSRTRTGELLPAEFLATFPELSTDPASRPRVFGFNKIEREKFYQLLGAFGSDFEKIRPFFRKKTFRQICQFGAVAMYNLSCPGRTFEYCERYVPRDRLEDNGYRVHLLLKIGKVEYLRMKWKACNSNGGILEFSAEEMQYSYLQCKETWTRFHDWLLIDSVLARGYTRWESVVRHRDSLLLRELEKKAISEWDRFSPRSLHFYPVKKVTWTTLNLKKVDEKLDLHCQERIIEHILISLVEKKEGLERDLPSMDPAEKKAVLLQLETLKDNIRKLESRQSDLQDVLCSKDPDRSTDIQDGESAGSGSEIVKNVPEKSTAIRIGHHIQFPELQRRMDNAGVPNSCIKKELIGLWKKMKKFMNIRVDYLVQMAMRDVFLIHPRFGMCEQVLLENLRKGKEEFQEKRQVLQEQDP